MDLVKDVAAANVKAAEAIWSARPMLLDIRTAREVIPGMSGRTVLHAGPPFAPGERVTGALRGTIIGAALYEGWASSPEQAAQLLDGGEIELRAAHTHDAVGTYCGGISPSAPVMVVENMTAGTRAYNNFNEGRGKALRYGAYSPEVLTRLRWLEGTFAPVLREAVQRAGGIEIFPLLSQALHMGDECHSRHKAASALLVNRLAQYLVQSSHGSSDVAEVLGFLTQNEIFFLNVTMAAAKSALLAAEAVDGASIVTAMARNGREFGIRVAAFKGRWFTAPVASVEGRYFEGYGPEDANPEIGDSAVSECLGLGAFSLVASSPLAHYMGLSGSRAHDITAEMYRITHGEHPVFTIPQLEYRGAPSCVDVRRVVATGITPITNTGVAHRDGVTGQIGAGYVRTPILCFEKALTALERDRNPPPPILEQRAERS